MKSRSGGAPPEGLRPHIRPELTTEAAAKEKTLEKPDPVQSDHATASERISVIEAAPGPLRAHVALDRAVAETVDPTVYELIKLRASQINGCAFCLSMHSQDAHAQGESEHRIHLLPAWREAPCYSERERAALALTEAVTRVADTHVPDDVWDRAAKVFSTPELAGVLMAIVTINGWNRIAISSRTPVVCPCVDGAAG